MASAPRFADYNRVAPTREGWVFIALVLGVLFGAVKTGNNLVYLVLGILLALLVVANVLAEWNLRGVWVSRRLPGELFEGFPGIGAVELENRRGRGTAWLVEVSEVGVPGAVGRIERCAPSERVLAPVSWTFPGRGAHTLSAIRIASTFPFGLVRRWRDLPVGGEVLVFPRPVDRRVPPAPTGAGESPTSRRNQADDGDFFGIRPWRPGDPLRRVHWPTSARSGAPMLVVRAAEGASEVVLQVDPNARGEAREETIRRVTGRALAHLEQGDAVGLELDGELAPARTGAAWRRRLLTTLALAPRR